MGSIEYILVGDLTRDPGLLEHISFAGNVLFGLRLYIPVNNCSVMSGRSHRFLGITFKDTIRRPE